MSRQQIARSADSKGRMPVRHRNRAGLALGKPLAVGPRSAEIEPLENRVLLAAIATPDYETADPYPSVIPTESAGLSGPVVTTLQDEANPNDGLISLREAIASAISGSTVSFNSSLAGGTIVLGGSELQILSKDLTITGLGANRLTVSGNHASRIFDVEGANVSISGLTIANGREEHGGGIRSSSSTLALSNCTLSGNAVDLDGGGIGSYSGTLTLTNCTFDSNSAWAGMYGGGVYSTGTATITNCTFTHNGGLGGGGVANSSGAKLTLTNCVFDHNSAGNGGGVRNAGNLTATGCTFTNHSVDYGGGLVNYGGATLNDCTFNNNSAENGAGIRNLGSLALVGCTINNNFVIDYGGAGIHNTGTATLTNSTLVGNVDGSGRGGAAILNSGTVTLNDCTVSGNITHYGQDKGGGIRTDQSALILRNTIVSGNSSDAGPSDIYGTADPASSHNLIGVGGGLTNGVNGNIVGVTDPKLGPLANNGGPTQTMALLGGSLALDAGDNSLIPSGVLDDQRGAGHARVANGAVDIGAYENGLPTDITLSDNSVVENRPVGTAVGILSSSDPDVGDTFTYTLVGGAGSMDNASFTISGNQLLTAAIFSRDVKNSYSVRIRTTDQGGSWYEKVFTINVVDADKIAPTVTAVYVRGSTWAPGYLSFLAANLPGSSSTYGYAIPVGSGAAQLQTLPWRNLNQISLRFSEAVFVAQAQFAIVGSAGNYSVLDFSYNSTDHVATWWLSAAIGPDKLYVAVPATGSLPVRDAAGNVLDGEWSNPSGFGQAGSTDTFPSGNGTAGGDFAFRFDVLPGDSSGGSLGKVNVADALQTKGRSGLPVSTSTYRSDFDGNNLVNVADVAYVKSKSSVYSLPVNPPVVPVFSTVPISESLLFRSGRSVRHGRAI